MLLLKVFTFPRIISIKMAPKSDNTEGIISEIFLLPDLQVDHRYPSWVFFLLRPHFDFSLTYLFPEFLIFSAIVLNFVNEVSTSLRFSIFALILNRYDHKFEFEIEN